MGGNRRADLVLKNRAEVNFHVGKDVSGNAAVISLEIAFPKGMRVPNGGIGATQLREIRINELLEIWFKESSRSFLSKSQENRIFDFVNNDRTSGGRNGLPESYYACISYLYVSCCDVSPRYPTALLAESLDVSTKTISTRLTKARKLGVLTPTKSKVSTGRAGGEITPRGYELIMELLKERK